VSETNDDPAALLEELGFSRDGDPEPDQPDLGDLRTKIVSDLEARQGPWRRMSIGARAWPAAIAAILGGWLMFVWPGGGLDGRPAVQLAAAAGTIAVLLCIVAATLAPQRPGLAERLSLGGLVFAVVALGSEGVLAATSVTTGFTADSAVKCGAMMLALAVIPLGLLVYNLWRSGLPGRPLHAVAATAAAFAVGGVAMWRHCGVAEPLHIVLSHVVLPALVAPGLALVLYTRIGKRAAD
jgi:hypothetical protein